jgi:response regulator RpfG family c-di-GMP phosphodiesterase
MPRDLVTDTAEGMRDLLKEGETARRTPVAEMSAGSTRARRPDGTQQLQMRDDPGELELTHLEVLTRLALVAEFREDPSGKHVMRVGHISGVLAQTLRLPAHQGELIRQAAPLHDVGKIGIPDHILLKSSQLTAEEFAIIQTHTTIGAEILGRGQSQLLRCAEEIALTHHERWDGTGYPHGLRGEAIPLAGRIVAMADAFDALLRVRAYRKAWSIERAIAEMERGSGTRFDPAVVDAFLAHSALSAPQG